MSLAKRLRITISCLVCRKRKLKCDRQRPVCGLCKKKLIAHLCGYDDETPNSQPHYFVSGNAGGYLPGIHSNLQGVSPPLMGMPRPPLIPMGNAVGSAMAIKQDLAGEPSPIQPILAGETGIPAEVMANGAATMTGASWGPLPLAYFDQFRLPLLSLPQLSPSLQLITTNGLPLNMEHTLSSSSTHFYDTSRAAQQCDSSPAIQSIRVRDNSLNNSPKDVVSDLLKASSISSGRQHNLRFQQHSADETMSQTLFFTMDHNQSNSRGRSKSLLSASFGPFTPSKFNEEVHTPDMDFVPFIADAVPRTSQERHHRSYLRTANSVSQPFRAEHTFQAPYKSSFLQIPENPRKDSQFVSVSIGMNVLRISVDDTIDSFSCASNTLLVEGPSWQQQGPMSYVGLTKRDSFFKLVRNFTVRLFRSEQFSQFVPNDQQSNSMHTSNSGNTRGSASGWEMGTSNCEAISEEDILNEDTLVTTKIHLSNKQNGVSDSTNSYNLATLPGLQSLNTLYRSKSMYYKFVEENVLLILPRVAMIHEAIRRYFRYVHPFVPIIHELTFMRDIKTLFGEIAIESEMSQTYQKISIKNEPQLNLAGLLLLIIRLGYMTLIPNNKTHMRYTQVELRLMKDVTKVKADHYLSIVNLCISEEKVQIKSSFKLVQSLTLLLFYRSVAPNDCFGLSGTDSQLLHGTIVNHALSIGLNRDPLKYDTINSIPKDLSFVVTWRSLWNYIVNIDAMISMYSGIPLKFPNMDSADTEKPRYEWTSEKVSEFSKTVENVCSCYRRIVNKTTNLSSKLKVIDLLMETSKLEKIFLEVFGKDFFKDYICGSAPEDVSSSEPERRELNEEAYLKVHRFLLFINTRANLSCLYYLVVMHYEEKLDEDPGVEAQAGIELFKIFIRSVVQLVYIMSYVLDNMQELFGKSYDYILTSRIERSMIKTHTFVSGFFIRLVNYKRTLALKQMTGKALASSNEEDFNERCEVVDSLFTIALLEAELFVGQFRALSKTYINSYKLYVMAFFVLKQCMENPELLLAGVTNSKELFFKDGTNLIQFLSNSELQSLCKLCEEFRIAKLELVRRQKEHETERRKKSLDQRQEREESGKEQHDDDGQSGENGQTKTVVRGECDSSRSSPSHGKSESYLEDDFASQTSGTFDPTLANRAMYANEDTVNTYGLLKEKHMHEDYQGEVFDEQHMIGNDELLKLFDSYGLLDG